MNISAHDIERWADSLDARADLPILIRRLIHATLPLSAILRIDFPGGAQIERKGLDGTLEVQEGNAWVPVGKSAWEMGTNKDITRKANMDFGKRSADADTTFVFVTPRNWPEKDQWAEGKKTADNGWRNIRVFDANNLEQWLEQAPSIRIWLVERMGRPATHLKSIDEYWKDWSGVTEPKLTTNLILYDRKIQRKMLEEKIIAAKNTSIHVAGDTREEAAAFICASLLDTEGELRCRQTIVVKNPEGYEQLKPNISNSETELLVIAVGQNVAEKMEVIPDNVTLLVAEAIGDSHNTENVIQLPKVSSFSLEDFLEGQALLKRTGHSISALRRYLAKNLSLRKPPWADVTKDNRNFIWLALAGGWNEIYAGDTDIITKLSGAKNYEDWRRNIEVFRKGENPPLEIVGRDKQAFRLYSRGDAFLLAAPELLATDVDKFLEIAAIVFESTDPLADIPPDKRWCNQQQRPHSEFLRKGLADGLILLSLYHEQVTNVCSLDVKLKDFFTKIFAHDKAWYALRDVLEQLAEANPDIFIKQLKDDLEQRPKEIETLFKPIEHPLTMKHFDSVHLMWALERLSWKPQRFPKVIRLFAELDRCFQNLISENYGNSPINSLRCIFRSWMPQTVANVAERKKVLKGLLETHSDLVVRIAMSVASHSDTTGDHNHTPTWHDDALDRPAVTHVDRQEAIRDASEIVTRCMTENRGSEECRRDIAIWMLHEFIFLKPKYYAEGAKDAVEAIKSSKWSDANRTSIYEKVLSESESIECYDNWPEGANDKEQVKAFFEEIRSVLEPQDPIERDQHKFSGGYRQWSYHQLDYDEQEKRLNAERTEVLQKILDITGAQGIARLVEQVKNPYIIGSLLKNLSKNTAFKVDDVIYALATANMQPDRFKQFLGELFFGDDGTGSSIAIITAVFERLENNNAISDETKGILLHALPVSAKVTWDFINSHPEPVKKAFFNFPKRLRQNEYQNPLVCDNLIDGYLIYKRPRLIFQCVTKPEHLPPKLLFRVLAAIGTKDDDGGTQDGMGMLNSDYLNLAVRYLERSLDILSDGDREEAIRKLVSFEFTRIKLINGPLTDSDGPLLIFQQLAKDPSLYLEVHSYLWSKDDDQQEIPKSNNLSENQREEQARDAWYLLFHWKSPLPGQIDDEIKANSLNEWVMAVRNGARKRNLTELIDSYIGEILARSPIKSNALIPDGPVCDILNKLNSKPMLEGFSRSRRNLRGFLINDIDNLGWSTGDLAKMYNEEADKLSETYPNLAEEFYSIAKLYRNVAERERDDTEKRNMPNY